jgi:2-dehydropantoate 2-reductase
VESPDRTPFIYGIVGDGNVARNIARYFSLIGTPYRQWSRPSTPTSHPPTSVEKTLHDCTHILLLITDSQIERFIESHPALRSKHLLHFSGSLVTPLAGGYHPLFSFADDDYDLSVYESIPFVCEADREPFERVFPSLPNRSVAMKNELKPYYHALCVLSGNAMVLVWKRVFEEFEGRMNLPRDFASFYLQSITQNLQRSPRAALTGPIARRDVATVRLNLHALKGDVFAGIYESVLDAFDPAFSEEVTS